MSTHATITAKLSNGKFKSVYVHSDGYPSHTGAILIAYYNTQERVDALLEHGDMSWIGARCDKPEGHSYETPVKDCTIYYGRDRGEENTNGGIGDLPKKAMRASRHDKKPYNYMWDGSKWMHAA